MTRPDRAARGGIAHARGLDAEALARAALQADGWAILGQRVRTGAGEIDLVARRGALLAFVEVKARATLADAAAALSARQQRRLGAAAAAFLAERPDLVAADVRFDVIVIDRRGQVRRIADAFRVEAA